MWSPKLPHLTRLLAAFALAGLTAGCFQPLYGEKAAGGAGITDKMSAAQCTERHQAVARRRRNPQRIDL